MKDQEQSGDLWLFFVAHFTVDILDQLTVTCSWCCEVLGVMSQSQCQLLVILLTLPFLVRSATHPLLSLTLS